MQQKEQIKIKDKYQIKQNKQNGINLDLICQKLADEAKMTSNTQKMVEVVDVTLQPKNLTLIESGPVNTSE